jgi:hypothetical protein
MLGWLRLGLLRSKTRGTVVDAQQVAQHVTALAILVFCQSL